MTVEIACNSSKQLHIITLVIPVVDDFKEISVRQKDADIMNGEIEVQLCVADGRLLELSDILLVSRHQQLTASSKHTNCTGQLSLLPSVGWKNSGSLINQSNQSIYIIQRCTK